jgi:hypothetical protein
MAAPDRTQDTHVPRYDSSERVIGPSQRPVPDNTQHSQETDIHAPGGIRTRNPRNRPRPRGHRDRPVLITQTFC